jgi:chromosome segregation ATPase
MEAADSLYGVTMGSDGISQIVSRRVPREAPVSAVA